MVAQESNAKSDKKIRQFCSVAWDFNKFTSFVTIFTAFAALSFVVSILLNPKLDSSQKLLDITLNRPKKLGECEGPFITIHENGRLGNFLCQYSAIYAYAKEFHMRAGLGAKMASTLAKIFPNLTIGRLPNCSFHWEYIDKPQLMENLSISDSSHIFIKFYPGPQMMTKFEKYRLDLIATDFRMRADLERSAEKFLRGIAESTNATRFVGVHVRRTDYSKHLRKLFNARTITGLYYIEAMRKYREYYKDHKVAFVATSDDKAWCRRVLGSEEGFHVTDSSASRELDMLILSKTNSTIRGYGSFSFWSVYLRPGGNVTLADGYYAREPPELGAVRKMAFPSWNLLRDPCFKHTNNSGPPELTDHCKARKKEYGIDDPFNLMKN